MTEINMLDKKTVIIYMACIDFHYGERNHFGRSLSQTRRM